MIKKSYPFIYLLLLSIIAIPTTQASATRDDIDTPTTLREADFQKNFPTLQSVRTTDEDLSEYFDTCKLTDEEGNKNEDLARLDAAAELFKEINTTTPQIVRALLNPQKVICRTINFKESVERILASVPSAASAGKKATESLRAQLIDLLEAWVPLTPTIPLPEFEALSINKKINALIDFLRLPGADNTSFQKAFSDGLLANSDIYLPQSGDSQIAEKIALIRANITRCRQETPTSFTRDESNFFYKLEELLAAFPAQPRKLTFAPQDDRTVQTEREKDELRITKENKRNKRIAGIPVDDNETSASTESPAQAPRKETTRTPSPADPQPAPTKTAKLVKKVRFAEKPEIRVFYPPTEASVLSDDKDDSEERQFIALMNQRLTLLRENKETQAVETELNGMTGYKVKDIITYRMELQRRFVNLEKKFNESFPSEGELIRIIKEINILKNDYESELGYTSINDEKKPQDAQEINQLLKDARDKGAEIITQARPLKTTPTPFNSSAREALGKALPILEKLDREKYSNLLTELRIRESAAEKGNGADSQITACLIYNLIPDFYNYTSAADSDKARQVSEARTYLESWRNVITLPSTEPQPSTTTIAPPRAPAPLTKSMVPATRANLFETVFGVTEAAFLRNYELLRYERDAQDFSFVTPRQGAFAGKKISCGKLKEHSLNQLISETDRLAPSATPGFFKVIVGDVTELQADPANRDAVFQVASRFHALDGSNLQNYVGNKTQGPTAALSALGGALLRHYFLYYNPATRDTKKWGQTSERFVNLLDDLTDIPPRSDGRPDFTTLPNAFPSDADCKNIKIAFHENIQVVADGGFKNALYDENQCISQALTSVIDLGAYPTALATDEGNFWVAAMLNASYEGTLRAAALHKKKKVFLTLMGGGVFANPPKLIRNAIVRMKDFVVANGLEVTIILYDKAQVDARLYEELQRLETETSATTTIAKPITTIAPTNPPAPPAKPLSEQEALKADAQALIRKIWAETIKGNITSDELEAFLEEKLSGYATTYPERNTEDFFNEVFKQTIQLAYEDGRNSNKKGFSFNTLLRNLAKRNANILGSSPADVLVSVARTRNKSKIFSGAALPDIITTSRFKERLSAINYKVVEPQQAEIKDASACVFFSFYNALCWINQFIGSPDQSLTFDNRAKFDALKASWLQIARSAEKTVGTVLSDEKGVTITGQRAILNAIDTTTDDKTIHRNVVAAFKEHCFIGEDLLTITDYLKPSMLIEYALRSGESREKKIIKSFTDGENKFFVMIYINGLEQTWLEDTASFCHATSVLFEKNPIAAAGDQTGVTVTIADSDNGDRSSADGADPKRDFLKVFYDNIIRSGLSDKEEELFTAYRQRSERSLFYLCMNANLYSKRSDETVADRFSEQSKNDGELYKSLIFRKSINDLRAYEHQLYTFSKLLEDATEFSKATEWLSENNPYTIINPIYTLNRQTTRLANKFLQSDTFPCLNECSTIMNTFFRPMETYAQLSALSPLDRIILKDFLLESYILNSQIALLDQCTTPINETVRPALAQHIFDLIKNDLDYKKTSFPTIELRMKERYIPFFKRIAGIASDTE